MVINELVGKQGRQQNHRLGRAGRAVSVLRLLGAQARWGSLRLPPVWGQLDMLGGALLGAVVGLLAVLVGGFLVGSSPASVGGVTVPLRSPLQGVRPGDSPDRT